MENDKPDSKKPKSITRSIISVVIAILCIEAAILLVRFAYEKAEIAVNNNRFKNEANAFAKEYEIKDVPDTATNTFLIPIVEVNTQTNGGNDKKKYLKVKIVKEIKKDPALRMVLYNNNKVRVRITNDITTFFKEDGLFSKNINKRTWGSKDGKYFGASQETKPGTEYSPRKIALYDGDGNVIGTYLICYNCNMYFSEDHKTIVKANTDEFNGKGLYFVDSSEKALKSYENLGMRGGAFDNKGNFFGIFVDALRYFDNVGNITYERKIDSRIRNGTVVSFDNNLYILVNFMTGPTNCELFHFDASKLTLSMVANDMIGCQADRYTTSISNRYIAFINFSSSSIYDRTTKTLVYNANMNAHGGYFIESILFDERSQCIVFLGLKNNYKVEVMTIFDNGGRKLYEREIGTSEGMKASDNFIFNKIQYSDNGKNIVITGNNKVEVMSLEVVEK